MLAQTFARTRSRNEQSATPVIILHNYGGTYPFTELETRNMGLANVVGTITTVKDSCTKNFKKLKAQGQIILHDFSLSKSTVSTSGTSLFTAGPTMGWGKIIYEGDLGYAVRCATYPENWIPVSEADSAAQIAVNKAHANLSKAPVMSGETLADLGKTVGMLRRPFKSSRDLLGRMLTYKQKRLGKTVNSAAKATADAWLEYRYGWKPILMDCDSIVQEYHKVRDNSVKRLVVRASETCSRSEQKSFANVGLSFDSRLKATGVAFASHESNAHAGIIYSEAPSKTSSECLRVFGARPRDIAPTIWEVIPYSFVVDWFVDVGSWLEAISPIASNHTILGSWVTTVTKRSLSVGPATLSYTVSVAPNPTFYGATGFSGISTEEVRRFCNPPVAITPTAITKQLSRLHLADAMALLTKPILDGFKRFSR